MRLHTLIVPDVGEGKDLKIVFSKARTESKNFFSVLVGENGTRKSQTLRNILDLSYSAVTRLRQTGLVVETKAGHLVYRADRQRTGGELPRKILAVSGVATDRFPSRLSSRIRKKDVVNRYRYIGPRSDNNLVSRAQSIQEIARVLISNINKVGDRLKQLSAALELLPIVKGVMFEFKVADNIDGRRLSQASLKKFIINNDRSGLLYKEPLTADILDEILILINWRGPIELRLDLEDTDFLGISPLVSPETLTYAFESGLIEISEPYAFLTSGERLALSEFSSGQWHILSSLLFVALAVENHTLILIDEPENSLHPHWQQEYLRLFDRAISSCEGVHVVVATHSPFVASSLPPSSAEVIKLKRSRYGNVGANLVPFGPFGWTADDILEEVFGLSSTRSQIFTDEMNGALKLFAKGNRTDPNLISRVEYLATIAKDLPGDDLARNVISTLSKVILGSGLVEGD